MSIIKFGYTIIYITEVTASLEFFGKHLDLRRDLFKY